MGWMELMLIGVIALIVVGPKDLPVMFQALGKMTAKVRRMAREFSTAMNDAANATGAGDIAKDMRGLASGKGFGMESLKDAADAFDKWEPGKEPRVMGSETAKLASERAEAARKIHSATAKREAEKRAAEAKATDPDAGDLVDDDPSAPPPAAPPAAKETAKPAAKSKAKPKAKPAAKEATNTGTTKNTGTAKKAKPAAKGKTEPNKTKPKKAPPKAKPAAKE